VEINIENICTRLAYVEINIENICTRLAYVEINIENICTRLAYVETVASTCGSKLYLGLRHIA
jgi:hypothetical protein